MKSCFVRVEAKPGPGLRIESRQGIAGYFQRLGITAKDEEDLAQIARDFVSKDGGSVLVNIDDLSVPDFAGVDRDIRDECEDISQRGVWYYSGRAFFADDDEEAGENT